MQPKITWALAGAGVMLIIIGIFYLGNWYAEKEYAAPQNPPIQREKEDSTSPPYSSSAPINSNNNKISVTEPASWKTFTNKSQGYKFSYPGTGKVVQMHTSGRKEDVDPTDGACVSLKLSGGYVTIWGRVNEPELATMCLRTGVGAEWSPAPDLPVALFGKKYTASGMQTASASAGYRKEFYHLNLATGEQVEFGIEVNEKYAPETSYAEVKDEILKVLNTLSYL